MEKFYLAGPMTGLPEYNFPEFDRYCEILRKKNFDIISPHEIDHGETPETRGSLDYHLYIKEGLKALLTCDAVILMPGWENSHGSRFEVEVARKCGMNIFLYQADLDLLTYME